MLGADVAHALVPISNDEEADCITVSQWGDFVPASSDAWRAESPCMGCRTNLKKEKRVRNRVNAFRFKKGGFTKRRFNNGPDYAADQKKADEDNKFYSLVSRKTSLWSPVVLSDFAFCLLAHRRLSPFPDVLLFG